MTSGAGITETGGKILAATLGMNAAGAIMANDAGNNVTTMSATSTGVTGPTSAITYQDADAVTVGAVAAGGTNFLGLTGINSSTGNGTVDVMNGAGTLFIANDINAGTGTVYLTSGAGITETGGKILAATLGMNAAGAIMANDAGNNVTTMSATSTGVTGLTSAITYQDADAVTVGAVAAGGTNFLGSTGINSSTGNGTVDVKNGAGTLFIANDINAGTGTVYLTSGAGITETGGKILAATLGMNAAGAIMANDAGNNVTTMSATSTGVTGLTSAITYQDADAVTVGAVAAGGTNFLGLTGINSSTGNGTVDVKNGAGTLFIANDINAGTGTVYLTSGAGITETGGKILAATLGMNAAGAIMANDAGNNVTTMSATSTGVTGPTSAITYQDADAVTVGAVAAGGTNFLGLTGINSSTGNGTVDVKNGAGTLFIANDINAGTGTVYLTSGAGITETGGKILAATLGMNAAGAIMANDAGNNVATMSATSTGVTGLTSAITYQDADAVTVGAVAAGGTNFLGSTGINSSTGNGTVDVKNGAGTLTVASDINAGSMVYLTSGAGISETGGKILADKLRILAGASVTLLQTGNDVNELAARVTGSGDLSYADPNNLTVATVGGTQGIDVAGTVWIRAKQDIILNSPVIGRSSTDDAVVLVADQRFYNFAGSAGVTAPSGRWLVYDNNPTLEDRLGGLPFDFRRLESSYDSYLPQDVRERQNGYLTTAQRISTDQFARLVGGAMGTVGQGTNETTSNTLAIH